MIPSDISAEQHEDILCRDRAERMATALANYGSARHFANKAVGAGDLRSAAAFRADARAALHGFPRLIAMVELTPSQDHARERCASLPAVLNRVGEWTGR
jgi:hypothetical protein